MPARGQLGWPVSGEPRSGGKRLPSKTRKANVYLRRSFCEAASGANRSKDTYLAALYRRQRSRLGHRESDIRRQLLPRFVIALLKCHFLGLPLQLADVPVPIQQKERDEIAGCAECEAEKRGNNQLLKFKQGLNVTCGHRLGRRY